ncbi:MAG: hypothetical protein JWN40_1854 [Phycisphaerales bacterium]|nr:hypothetical protein [Phycisphaerales bacterium]
MRTIACTLMLLLPIFALAQPKPFEGPSVDFSHGPLRVSDNLRFLIHADGTPFFYLADTAWELFHRLTLKESEQYLENRRAKGFTVIQAVALAEFDGLGTPNRQNHLPLIDNDPTKPSEDYFKDLDAVISIAEKKGLYIGFLPTWGDKVNKKWGKGPEIFTPANAKTYGEFLGNRYKDRPNIIWILGGDRDITNDAQRETWRAMAAGLQAGDNKSHLITFHPMGSRHSAKDWHADDWLAFNMIQSGHAQQNLANYKMITEDYNLSPIKPCMDAEPRYEDHPVRGKKDGSYFDDYDTRQAAYWSVFAGAMGHTYGHHSIWSMHNLDAPPAPGVPAKEMHFTWDKAIDRPGGQAMTHLRRLIESRPFLSRIPDQTLIAAGQGEGIDHVQAIRGERYAMLYLPTSKPVTVHLNMIGVDKLKAWWFNPNDGGAIDIGTFDATIDKQFTPNGETGRRHDIVLVLDDVSKNWDAPSASYHPK